MVGKLSAARKIALFRLWDRSWQRWTEPVAGSFQLSNSVNAMDRQAVGLCALPAGLVISSALWVDSADDDMVRSIVSLDMEMKGLATDDRLAANLIIYPVLEREGRQLVIAAVFPPELPDEISCLPATYYLPSPFLIRPQGSGIWFWREGEDYVAALFWREHLVCWETCDASLAFPEISGWLRRFCLELFGLLDTTDVFSFVDCTGLFPQPPLEFVAGPADKESPPFFDKSLPLWQSASIRGAESARSRRQSLSRLALAAGLVALLAVLYFIGNRIMIERAISASDRQIARLEEASAPLRRIAATWQEVAPAADPHLYPLDSLRAIVLALPTDGVHLTSFQFADNQIAIEGKAQNVGMVTAYLEKLRGNAAAPAAVQWDMPPPALQSDNTTRFVINGVRQQ